MKLKIDRTPTADPDSPLCRYCGDPVESWHDGYRTPGRQGITRYLKGHGWHRACMVQDMYQRPHKRTTGTTVPSTLPPPR